MVREKHWLMRFFLKMAICTLMTMRHSPTVFPVEKISFQLRYTRLVIFLDWNILTTPVRLCTKRTRRTIHKWLSPMMKDMALIIFMVSRYLGSRMRLCRRNRYFPPKTLSVWPSVKGPDKFLLLQFGLNLCEWTLHENDKEISDKTLFYFQYILTFFVILQQEELCNLILLWVGLFFRCYFPVMKYIFMHLKSKTYG